MSEPGCPDLEAAIQAQRRVWELRTSGADSRSQPVRSALNQLMSRIRKLEPAALAEFEEWRDREETASPAP